MEGSCSTGQSPQWAVVPMEEEEVFVLQTLRPVAALVQVVPHEKFGFENCDSGETCNSMTLASFTCELVCKHAEKSVAPQIGLHFLEEVRKFLPTVNRSCSKERLG
jgi:hypothetical protein